MKTTLTKISGFRVVTVGTILAGSLIFSPFTHAAEKAVTPREWLKGLAAGQSYITNGPFLELRAAGRGLGETVALAAAGPVEIAARAVGRADFERIELVQNGNVIRSEASRPEAGHFVAEMRFPLKIDGISQIPARISVPRDLTQRVAAGVVERRR